MGTKEKQRLSKIYKESKLKLPYTEWSFVRRFWTFQNERIPLLAMAAVALSLTTAVTKLHGNFGWPLVLIASAMVVLYFLQIRLADEPKDFEHDNKYYPHRPVQRGLITLKELAQLKNGVIGSFLLLGVLTGSWVVVLLAIFQQFYSFLTRQEFFMRDWLRRHFLTYQFSHYVQLFILAWLILTVLEVQPLAERFVYFVYAMLMIGMVEASRTIGGEDKRAAKDRYSYRLGMGLALSSFVAFTLAVTGYTVFLIDRTAKDLQWAVLALGLLVITVSIIKYMQQPTTKSAELMNAASLVMYLSSAITLLLSA
ncbi:MAG TPA: hypothetical protein VK694_04445 [Verrucomicrobiae bacterium]|nr:hypothetical protein [Verrucomicrobiae bacterium]